MQASSGRGLKHMKNEKIIDMIAAARAKMNDDEKKTFDAVRKMINAGVLTRRDASALADSVAAILGQFAADLDADEKTESAKRTGTGAAKKALEKILKNAPQDFLKKARTVNGRQIVCDGFTLCALDQPVELSPEFVQDVNDGRADGIINRVLPAARENNGDALRVPDAATLRLYIKNNKAEKKTRKDKTPVKYDFGDGLPAVNAEYLANIIDIYGDAVQLIASSRGPLNAVYIKSERGEGVIMPIRKV